MSINPPFVGMLLLTFAVWVLMFIKRMSYIKEESVDAESLSTPEKASKIFPERVNNTSNNFKNLFELPILFYVLCLFLMHTNLVDSFHVYCAYGFFVFRAVHSAIHCTYNNVNQRFLSYLVSSIFLWVMVLRTVAAVF